MGKGCSLPAKGLSRIEFFITGAGRYDAILLYNWKKFRAILLCRKLNPSLIRVGNDNYLKRKEQVLVICSEAFSV
jgi:hypothetical protein